MDTKQSAHSEREPPQPLPLGTADAGPEDWAGVMLLSGIVGVAPEITARQLAALHQSRRRRCSLNEAVADLLAGRWHIRGVGPAALRQLDCALGLATWLAKEELGADYAMDSPVACEGFLLRHLSGREREVFCCLFLNSRNRLIAAEDLFLGTIDGAAVYPREVVARSLALGASAVVIAHNHPSGSIQPSQADLRITDRLRDALNLVDIRLLDHFIVGRGQVFSMAAQGVGGFI